MFSSKGMKTFCNVVAIVAYVLSAIAMIYGVAQFSGNSILQLVAVVGAFVFAIVVTISLYPLYALADMSEKLESIERKMERFEFGDNSAVNYVEKTEELFKSNRDDTDKEEYRKKRGVEVSLQDVFEFVNNRYDINLRLDDSYEELKAKIESIEDTSPQALRLIKKVSEAKSTIEIISFLRMHKATNS